MTNCSNSKTKRLNKNLKLLCCYLVLFCKLEYYISVISFSCAFISYLSVACNRYSSKFLVGDKIYNKEDVERKQ